MAAQKTADKTAKTWIVRDREGKIFGPFSTDQVLQQIDRGYFMGGEDVALYPGGRWIPISNTPEFYDRLLDALALEGADRKPEERKSTAQENSQQQGSDVDDVATFAAQPVQQSQSLVSTRPSAGIELQTPMAPAARSQTPDVIELTDLKKLEALEEEAEEEETRSPLPVILVLVALLLGGVVYFK
jgi:hypothetical protein